MLWLKYESPRDSCSEDLISNAAMFKEDPWNIDWIMKSLNGLLEDGAKLKKYSFLKLRSSWKIISLEN